MAAARAAGGGRLECSLDLQRTMTTVDIDAAGWGWGGSRFPHLERCKERTVYRWGGGAFEPVARYATSLIKLVPTEWGPPTFEIDGIKMLPTARVSPYADAERKVALIEPRGKRILDTCGGLGYFAAWAVERLARHVLSYEKNPDVCWLREVNPWSPAASGALTLIQDDITRAVTGIEAAAFDAVLHDPPRFGIAGDLYSQRFYEQLARVLRRGGSMFHYTGNPQKWSSGRDLGGEVLRRLRCAGFRGEKIGDGILAVKG